MVDGRMVFDRDQELEKLNVVNVEVTNPELNNAIDLAQLNLLVEEDDMLGFSVWHTEGGHSPVELGPGSKFTPEPINEAFSVLAKEGYRYIRPARSIYWKNTDSNYWIQWTSKDNKRVLWAFDPELNKAVEILQVRSKS